jgi:hypothetical protein
MNIIWPLKTLGTTLLGTASHSIRHPHHYNHYYHLYAGFLQFYTWKKPCFWGIYCCGCSVLTVCAAYSVTVGSLKLIEKGSYCVKLKSSQTYLIKNKLLLSWKWSAQWQDRGGSHVFLFSFIKTSHKMTAQAYWNMQNSISQNMILLFVWNCVW